MAAPEAAGQPLALRILLKPNPDRQNVAEWRVPEVVKHAQEVLGCKFAQNSASTMISTKLVKKGLVQSRRGEKSVVLYSLTPAVRAAPQGCVIRFGLTRTRAPAAQGRRAAEALEWARAHPEAAAAGAGPCLCARCGDALVCVRAGCEPPAERLVASGQPDTTGTAP